MDAHAALTSRRPSCAEGVLAALLGAWLLWALLATALTGRTIGDGVEYAALPMVLGVGLVLGWLCARWAGGFVLSAATTALALTVLVTPFYANAQAAVGVQLVALSGLLLSTALAGRPVASRGGKRKRSTTAAVVLPVLTGVLGVLLAARAEAASILVVAVAALVALALALAVPVGVSRVVGVASIGIGLVGVAGALVVVIVLARLPVWPQWLEEDDSLSWARQLLWRDALELWGEHPVVGAGPGSFVEHSEVARSEPHLYAVHSSVLQVGAELGAVGAVLFLAVLVAGASVAAQGDRARALIGVGAWCALAVHSMIDHLYEFPVVVVLAGVVIGWAGASARRGRRAPVD
ncbi:MAG: O-antigen ligase family protein [Brachybacterium alimentarium]|uniref:O-antigen ligase family protein n=1 Tax=Brachybacterium alimentarium TaxID=47845 RepID=UPI000DF269B5|nr:O-antigen ligase family protein [Brachybacterium alimentarium]RCS77441.1 O-antigen ligase domain-containing protein [Brachybacterium alimentarium]RCS85272.1 O-antigen ligase domain-containing protein [Brachybacterium alimentarium]